MTHFACIFETGDEPNRPMGVGESIEQLHITYASAVHMEDRMLQMEEKSTPLLQMTKSLGGTNTRELRRVTI